MSDSSPQSSSGFKEERCKNQRQKIVQASAQVTELYKANVMTKPAKMSAKAVKSLNTSQAVHNYPKYNAHLAADHHYDEFHQLGKKQEKDYIRKIWMMQKLRSANWKCKIYLKPNFPIAKTKNLCVKAKMLISVQKTQAVEKGSGSCITGRT